MRILYLFVLAATFAVIVHLIRWFIVMVVTLARGPGLDCPACGCRRTHRSMPRIADALFPAFVLPRRCESCRKRYFSLQSVRYTRRARQFPAITLR